MSRRLPEGLVRVLPSADVVLVGLFSAKDKHVKATMDALAARVHTHGGRVVGRFRPAAGVSDGGVHKMTWPCSRRTLISPGKAQEVAEACRTSGAGAAVFANP